jgi:hypothetical protein
MCLSEFTRGGAECLDVSGSWWRCAGAGTITIGNNHG